MILQNCNMCRTNKVSHVENKQTNDLELLPRDPESTYKYTSLFLWEWLDNKICLWNTDAPGGNKVKNLAKAESPTIWPRPNPKGRVMSTDDGWETLWWITVQIWLLCNHPNSRCKHEEITDKRIYKRTKRRTDDPITYSKRPGEPFRPV